MAPAVAETEAALPVEPASTDAGAVMAAAGPGVTVTVLLALATQPFASFTSTL